MKILPLHHNDTLRVQLIASPRRIVADLAAKITRLSDKQIGELLLEPADVKLVRRVLDSGHDAILQMDMYVVLVACSRVAEVQIVRKHHMSPMFHSGRVEKEREYEVVVPEELLGITTEYKGVTLGVEDICSIIEQWSKEAQIAGAPQEDIRYMKQMGARTYGLIAMNAQAWLDFFKRRCCRRAQYEIRSIAQEAKALLQQCSPEIFKNAGAPCKSLGYCPENSLQDDICRKAGIPTQQQYNKHAVEGYHLHRIIKSLSEKDTTKENILEALWDILYSGEVQDDSGNRSK